ncbi:alanyl-tRNA editing protein Aarsd1-A isoform X2 [Uranotaenia lowii]|uniref:alanyl-tRNA editing protein Aarsd1-A isoform X2 n=1 Tax=Uranotaenia lowii TaxID=190385 RepID=UPI00247AF3D5|nr:alanyl-tRNA editing protein Aarsd1-A isoform X2 [Uranotaenia lowii]
MVFKCQEDSFLTEFSSEVVACDKVKDGYDVIFRDTILFPEGGGQPTDHGWLNGTIPVRNITRKGPDAIHRIEVESAPFAVGDLVSQKVDWDRRFDHMQQHSGQHLITALFDREYGFGTKSWWLGSEDSYVDLNASDVTREQLDRIEQMCNQLIVDCTAVTVKVYAPDDPMLQSDVTRATRGLPKDVSGPLRVVSIDGVESNMCCGTHVRNLAQLQAIKFLNVEKSKNKCLVHFLVGGRVLRKLTECYDREKMFNKLLKGGPVDHINLVKELQSTVKLAQKTSKKLITEAALLEANKLNSMDPIPRFYSVHRQDGPDSDFMNCFARNVSSPNCFLFLTNGDDSGKSGQMVLQGLSEDILKLGDKICELLEGKGNGKGTRYNAKVTKLKAIDQCQTLIESYFAGQCQDNNSLKNEL